jgi:hypothetical protein
MAHHHPLDDRLSTGNIFRLVFVVHDGHNNPFFRFLRFSASPIIRVVIFIAHSACRLSSNDGFR